MKKTILIIGGTSGLGLEMGKLFSHEGGVVYATGRSPKPLPENIIFTPLRITESLKRLSEDLDELVRDLPPLDLFVHAAGEYENGHLSELSDSHIAQVIHVGIVTPAMILRRVLLKQNALPGLIAVTSTSQWIPRELEPLYTASKAGLAMLAQSASLDERVKKTLVVGPAGMDTSFWKGTGRDVTDLLDPKWVAGEIVKLWKKDSYAYRQARIIRDPPRVEILETR